MALNRIRPSIDSHFPDRVCTLFATATWVCRSGSPARESRWVNAVATSPVTSTWRTPSVPSRVYRACCSMNASASATASLWASSTCAATCGGAIAHRVLTDFTGENVRSYPPTAVVRGRDSFAIVPDSSRASRGSRPCSARKISAATFERIRARSWAATG